MATRHPSGVTRLLTTTLLFIQLNLEPGVYIHFPDPTGKTESESIGIFGFVILLPLTVAGLADANPTFAFGVASVAPYIDCVINR